MHEFYQKDYDSFTLLTQHYFINVHLLYIQLFAVEKKIIVFILMLSKNKERRQQKKDLYCKFSFIYLFFVGTKT